jgi:DNA recombination protein RmuC
MSAVWLFVGLIVGAGIAVLVMRERLRTLRDGQQQMSDSFKAMSAEALEASARQLSELAKTQLQASNNEAKGELEKRQQAVEQLVKPLQLQLERLNEERTRSGAQLNTQIKTLVEAQERLRHETGALVGALRRPNAAGQWGQMQLRRVVELAGMLDHCDFNEQVSYTGEDDRTLRPDMVINLPGQKQIVVDSKAPPVEHLVSAQAAPDDETRMRHLRALSTALRAHVRALGDKRYWANLDSTPDFVVLFLPGEYLYGAALEADPGLMEEAMTRHVLIATPTTLLALLHSAAYGWQQERLADEARLVADLGRELHGRLAKLSGYIANVGTRLNSTVDAYNKAVGSYEARVLPSARRFADHGVVAQAAEIPEVPQVTLQPRTLNLAAEDERAIRERDAADQPPSLFEQVPTRRLRAAE